MPRSGTPRDLPDKLRIAAFAIAALLTAVSAIIFIGYSMDDPGGLLGIGIVLTAAACAAAIGWVDRKWPRIGLGILIVAGTIGVGFHLLMRYGPIDSDILQGQQVEWWLVALAFVPLGVYVLAAWHARHHQREGALVLLVFGLLFAVSIVPGLVLSQPAILCGVLLLASDHLAAKRQQPTT